MITRNQVNQEIIRKQKKHKNCQQGAMGVPQQHQTPLSGYCKSKDHRFTANELLSQGAKFALLQRPATQNGAGS